MSDSPFVAMPDKQKTAAQDKREAAALAADERKANKLKEQVQAWEEKISASKPLMLLNKTDTPAAVNSLMVCVRKRPMLEDEVKVNGTLGSLFHDVEYENVLVHDPLVYLFSEKRGFVSVSTGELNPKPYRFHKAFDEHMDTSAVYANLKPHTLDFVLQGGGRRATIIAYGQTGTGKTYTQVGIAELLATDLFAGLPSNITCTVSMFENSGDLNLDLLNKRQRLDIRTGSGGHVHVQGLSNQSVASYEELQVIINKANALRATAPTENNPTSSRSHSIMTITLSTKANVQVENGDEQAAADADVYGVIRIVDLAGSERKTDSYHHSIERLQEMKDINWSLSCLKECARVTLDNELKLLKNPDAKPAHVPYRNSKLTMLLRDALEEPSSKVTDDHDMNNAEKKKIQNEVMLRTVFISHISPMASNFNHTRSTLDYTTQLMATADAKAAQKQVKKKKIPSEWTKLGFTRWLAKVENGRYAKIVDSFQINGKTMATMWSNDVRMRVKAAGMTEADGDHLHEIFQAAEHEAKMARKKSGKQIAKTSKFAKFKQQQVKATPADRKQASLSSELA